MKTICIIFISLFLNLVQTSESRTKLELMQGIWQRNSIESSEPSYKIIAGKNSLSFNLSETTNNFSLSETIIGFQDKSYEELDSINTKLLKDDGKYYTVILNKEHIEKNGWIDKAYCVVASYFECDGENMSINSGKLSEYVKIKRLPNYVLAKLYERGKMDNHNYLKEYLHLEIEQIKKQKCIIYSTPDVATNMYLIKNDIIVILESNDSWLKIEFNGSKLVTGWIKKEDIR